MMNDCIRAVSMLNNLILFAGKEPDHTMPSGASDFLKTSPFLGIAFFIINFNLYNQSQRIIS
jgi:hypothetical protein